MKQRLREAKDRLSDADMIVANFYSEHSVCTPGPSRATATCWKRTPNTPARTLSTSTWRRRLEKSNRKAEALPYYERLVQEFEKSEYLEETTRRIDRLKQELKLGAAVER